MKRLFSILALLIVLISLPIYGATRILLPNWIKNQLEAKLPKGSVLEIGSIKSDMDLSIVYKNVVYSQGSVKIEFPNLVFEPRLSIENPLVLNAEAMKILFNGNLLMLNDVQIRAFPKSLRLNDLNLEGSLGELSKQESMLIQNMNFLISEIGKKQLNFQIKADRFSSSFALPLGLMNLNMSDLGASIHLDNGLKTDIRSNSIDFSFTDFELKELKRTLSGNNFAAKIDLEKRKAWTLPLSVMVKDVLSGQGSLAESMQFSAIGVWENESSNCDFVDIFQSSEQCGKLINLLNVAMVLKNSDSELEFTGDGLCVAPRSGCLQKINSDIKSNNTNLIFSNIMKSGFLNPLVGGIILGSLLSSPVDKEAEFEHQVNFKVLGSKILLNDSPLIQ